MIPITPAMMKIISLFFSGAGNHMALIETMLGSQGPCTNPCTTRMTTIAVISKWTVKMGKTKLSTEQRRVQQPKTHLPPKRSAR